MNGVKGAHVQPLPSSPEPHVLALVGRLLELARRALLTQDVDGLRPSHFRLLSHVPPGGISISELGAALSMTKQGVGQFVTQLERTGHVQVVTDQADRRRRVVERTPMGDRLVSRANRTIENVERHWQEQVGVERYQVFRDVLIQIGEVDAHSGPDAEEH